jgi:MFS superfamily sulfate permease-like transporter
MCFLETASVAKTVRRASEPPIDNNQELAANGLSCIAGAFFRAMPSAGGFSQTAINQRAGAATQLSEMVTVVLAVSCALFLGGVLSDLPAATLSCLVVIAVLGLVQPGEFVRFWRLSKPEFWVAVLTALSGLFAGMLVAVLVGVLLTLFLVIWELDHMGVTELQPTADGNDVQVAGDATAPEPGLLMLRIDGPLYTANVRTVNRRILAALDAADGIDTLVLDLAAVAMPSVTAAMQFTDLEREVASRGVTLWLAAVPPRTMAAVRQMARFSELLDSGGIHPTALAAARAHQAR